MGTLTALVGLVTISAASFSPVSQSRPAEDVRVNLTRVLIEKARTVGQSNTSPTLLDGYKAIEEMVWERLPRESAYDLELRLQPIRDLSQGITDAERNPVLKGKITFQPVMGEKVKNLDHIVILRFIYPEGVVAADSPIKGYEWHLYWAPYKDRAGAESHRLVSVHRFTAR